MRAAERRVAVIAAAGCLHVGCFVDINHYYGSGGSSTAASTGATTGAGATTTGPVTSTAVESSGGGSTGAGDPTTGTGASTGPVSSTTAGTTVDLPAPVCPAIDAFMSPQTADPTCDACLREQCCAEFEACAGDCADVWSCAHGQDCLTAWAECPGYPTHEAAFGAATTCMNTSCHAACNIGPCAAEVTACDIDPECGAIGECSDACIADCPDCALECWGMCKEQHPEGAAEWDAFWACVLKPCA